MNVQKTLSVICNRKHTVEKKINLQSESRNERQLIYRKMNADCKGKRFLLKKNKTSISFFNYSL